MGDPAQEDPAAPLRGGRQRRATLAGGISFIGSEKRVLHRCLREAGVVLTAEASARLDALPERFLEFTAAPPRLDVAA